MAAVVEFTSGTLTTLLTPTAGNTATGSGSAGNVPAIQTLNPADFTANVAQGMGAIPSEIEQFIRLLSAGDAANSVTGWGFDYWTTAVLVQKFLQAHISKGAPSSYSPV